MWSARAHLRGANRLNILHMHMDIFLSDPPRLNETILYMKILYGNDYNVLLATNIDLHNKVQMSS